MLTYAIILCDYLSSLDEISVQSCTPWIFSWLNHNSYSHPVYVQLIIIWKCYLLICCLCFYSFLPPTSKVLYIVYWTESLYFRMNLNFWSFCFYFLSTWSTGVCHCTGFIWCCDWSQHLLYSTNWTVFHQFLLFSSVLKNTPSTSIHR